MDVFYYNLDELLWSLKHFCCQLPLKHVIFNRAMQFFHDELYFGELTIQFSILKIAHIHMVSFNKTEYLFNDNNGYFDICVVCG